MNDQDFDRAIRALREQGEQPAPQARITKERILRDLRPTVRRRRAAWFIPLAALLAGSTVLAATGGLPAAYHAAARALGLEARAVPAPVKATPTPSRSAVPEETPAPAAIESATPVAEPPATPVVALPATPAVEAPASPAVPDAGALRRIARRSAASKLSSAHHGDETPVHSAEPPPQTTAVPTAETAVDDQGSLALYRHARQLHFVEQKPAAALAAWDAYLAAEPRGPLSVDARYDRALCLVRLGRKQEARAALEPFAAGKYGSYRQSEARALLNALP